LNQDHCDLDITMVSLDMPSIYYTPSNTVTTHTVEKKSKFITCVTEVASKDEAVSHLRTIAAREVGANHNCSAYIIGNPSSPKNIHCSDDGEPSGTAGKPLLNILLHENVGNVLVVVTRYFGGIKLGSGGLVRAYSNGLKTALEDVVLTWYEAKKRLTIRFPYPFEGAIRRMVEDSHGTIVETEYGVGACFTLDIFEKNLDSFIADLCELTGGQAGVDIER
jgi:uncharacterized YigZ family protein